MNIMIESSDSDSEYVDDSYSESSESFASNVDVDNVDDDSDVSILNDENIPEVYPEFEYLSFHTGDENDSDEIHNRNSSTNTNISSRTRRNRRRLSPRNVQERNQFPRLTEQNFVQDSQFWNQSNASGYINEWNNLTDPEEILKRSILELPNIQEFDSFDSPGCKMHALVDIDSLSATVTDPEHLASYLITEETTVDIPCLIQDRPNPQSRLAALCRGDFNPRNSSGGPSNRIPLHFYKNIELFRISTDIIDWKVYLYLADERQAPVNNHFSPLFLAVIASALNAARKDAFNSPFCEHASISGDTVDSNIDVCEIQYQDHFRNIYAKMPHFMHTSRSKSDIQNKVQTLAHLDGRSAHNFLKCFKMALLNMSGNDNVIWKHQYHHYEFHRSGSFGNLNSEQLAKQFMSAAHDIVIRGLYHAQSVGLKEKVYSRVPGLFVLKSENDAAINAMIQPVIDNLVDKVNENYWNSEPYSDESIQEDPRKRCLFCMDIGMQVYPANTEISLFPNGFACAQYLESIKILRKKARKLYEDGILPSNMYIDETTSNAQSDLDVRRQGTCAYIFIFFTTIICSNNR